jgi:hypothetical protein
VQGLFSLQNMIVRGQGLTFGESLSMSIVAVAFCLLAMHIDHAFDEAVERDDRSDDEVDQ